MFAQSIEIAKQAQELSQKLQNNTADALQLFHQHFNQLYTQTVDNSLNSDFFMDFQDLRTTFTFGHPQKGYNPQKLKYQNLTLQNNMIYTRPNASYHNFTHFNNIMHLRLQKLIEKQMQYENTVNYSPDDSRLFELSESMIMSSLESMKFSPNKFQFKHHRRQSPTTDKITLQQLIQQIEELNLVNTKEIITIQAHIRGQLTRKLYKYIYGRVVRLQEYFIGIRQRLKFQKIIADINNLNYKFVPEKDFFDKIAAFNKNQQDFVQYYNKYHEIGLKNQKIKSSNDFSALEKQKLQQGIKVALNFPIQFSETSFFDITQAEAQLKQFLLDKGHITIPQLNQFFLKQITQFNRDNQYKVNLIVICNNIGIAELGFCFNNYIDQVFLITNAFQPSVDYYMKIVGAERTNVHVFKLPEGQGDVYQKLLVNTEAMTHIKQYLKINEKRPIYLINLGLGYDNIKNVILFEKHQVQFVEYIKAKVFTDKRFDNNILNLNQSKQLEMEFNKQYIDTQLRHFLTKYEINEITDMPIDILSQKALYQTSPPSNYQFYFQTARDNYYIMYTAEQARQSVSKQKALYQSPLDMMNQQKQFTLVGMNEPLAQLDQISSPTVQSPKPKKQLTQTPKTGRRFEINQRIQQKQALGESQASTMSVDISNIQNYEQPRTPKQQLPEQLVPVFPVKDCDIFSAHQQYFINQYINKNKQYYQIYVYQLNQMLIKRRIKIIKERNITKIKEKPQTMLDTVHQTVQQDKFSVLQKTLKYKKPGSGAAHKSQSDTSQLFSSQFSDKVNQNCKTVVYSEETEKTVHIIICSLSFLLIEDQVTFLSSAQDICQFDEYGIPLRLFGHIIPAANNLQQDMKKHSSGIINTLIKHNYYGFYTIHFMTNEEQMEPFNVTFGLTKQVQMHLVRRKLKNQNAHDEKQFIYVKGCHTKLFLVKKKLKTELLKYFAFDTTDKTGWYLEIADPLIEAVCFEDSYTLEIQRQQLINLYTQILNCIHQTTTECATSILNQDNTNQREVELTSNINGLVTALQQLQSQI